MADNTASLIRADANFLPKPNPVLLGYAGARQPFPAARAQAGFGRVQAGTC